MINVRIVVMECVVGDVIVGNGFVVIVDVGLDVKLMITGVHVKVGGDGVV